MTVTIYDVAKRASVGIGTVSRAINDSPQISSDTKDRVLKAIKELNYQPHALAQGLARKKTNMVAVILPQVTGYFYHELLRGIQNKISEFGYDLILYSVDQSDKTQLFLQKSLRERRVDGVLLISLKIPEKKVKRFRQAQTPIVLVDSYHPKVDSITVENEQGAYMATQHLIQLGHKRIGIIDAHLRSMPAQVRLNGYKNALKENKIPFEDKLLAISSDTASEEDGFNQAAGYEAMSKFLQLGGSRPTAVFVASDIQALGAMKALSENKLKCPEDMAIVGFDDIEMSEYLGLSTIRQPMYDMGKLGVERLMECISSNPEKIMHQSFATELIVRETCGGLSH